MANEQGQDGRTGGSFLTRRQFLSRLTIALGGLGAAAAGVPFIGFLVSPLIREQPEIWRAVGGTEEFTIGETVKVTFEDAEVLPWAGFAGRSAAFVRRQRDEEFVAFSVYCTHVGCPVRWEEGASLFMCPCHGGTFHRDGRVAGGPPTRPLDRYAVRVRDGQVEIRTRPFPLPD